MIFRISQFCFLQAVPWGQGQEEEDKHEGDGSDVNSSAATQWESLDALENSIDADATPMDSP